MGPLTGVGIFSGRAERPTHSVESSFLSDEQSFPLSRRNAPTQSGRSLIATYEVRDGQIVKAWFIFGPKHWM
jgi:hypothetical protein